MLKITVHFNGLYADNVGDQFMSVLQLAIPLHGFKEVYLDNISGYKFSPLKASKDEDDNLVIDIPATKLEVIKDMDTNKLVITF